MPMSDTVSSEGPETTGIQQRIVAVHNTFAFYPCACYHRVGGRGSEGTKESERQESSQTSLIAGCVLRFCADQLAGLFTSIFNESLATSVVPTSFKKSVIMPVPKNSKPSCLNDNHPVALTSTVTKVFERL